MSTAAEWDALGGIDGCEHDLTAGIMTRHPVNWPPLAVQERTHGAGMPEPDRGISDGDKYGGGNGN